MPQFFYPLTLVAQSSIESDYQSFLDQDLEYSRENPDRTANEDMAATEQLFNIHFGPHVKAFQNGSVSGKNLLILYDAVLSLVFETHTLEGAQLLVDLTHSINESGMALIAEKVSRERTYAQKTYDQLINDRRFELAENLLEAYPEKINAFLYPLDEYQDSDGLTIISLNESDNTINLNNVSLHEGDWLVAVVRPGCPFSLTAMKTIEQKISDGALDLPENVVWVIGQNLTTSAGRILDWNRQSEYIDINIAYRNSSWPTEMRLTSTPVFYWVRAGNVLDSPRGWVDDSRYSDFSSFVERIKAESELR